MKQMKKTTHGNNALTLGELVTLAYDIAQNRRIAVRLLGTLLGGVPVRSKVNTRG